jgi:hypothetical protein
MATFVDFKCKKCNKKFSFCRGVLQNDLVGVKVGEELPEGAKLPSKEEFGQIYNSKTPSRADSFVHESDCHASTCDGEVVLTSIAEGH